jgi:hypothetical protein
MCLAAATHPGGCSLRWLHRRRRRLPLRLPLLLPLFLLSCQILGHLGGGLLALLLYEQHPHDCTLF